MPTSNIGDRSNHRRRSGLRVRGEVRPEYFFVSKEQLERLRELPGTSDILALVIGFFSIAFGIVITLVTANISDKFIYGLLMSAAAVFLILGILNTVAYSRVKKKKKEICDEVYSNPVSFVCKTEE